MTRYPRRIALVACAAVTLAATAAWADGPASGPVQLPPPPPGKAEVVFFRKPLFSLVPFNWIAREGKTEVCKMEAATYCIAVVDPGTHTYEVHSEVKNDLTLEADAGETYYVIGGISMGLIVNHPNISPVQKADFDAISAKLKSIAPLAAPSSSDSPAPAAQAPAGSAPAMTPPPAADPAPATAAPAPATTPPPAT